MQSIPTVRIERLELEQFRVYRDLYVDIPPAGLRIVGRNGTGKSTLLEAIELLSTTRPRAGANDADVIAFGSGHDLGVPPYARVICEARRGDSRVRLEAFVQQGARRGTTKKQFRIAERPRRAADVLGLLPTVTFTPDDMDLVLGSPMLRRRYLDVLLSQVDRRYLRHLARYQKIVTQRNGLLRDESLDAAHRDEQLSYWDEQLVALGSYIVAARQRAVAAINVIAQHQFGALSPASGTLQVEYASSVHGQHGVAATPVDVEDVLDLAQHVGPIFEQHLRQRRVAEVARGSTLVGPHRDDLTLSLDERPVDRFASRGQQRLVVLALKMAEIQYSQTILGVRPVLLLDDILSELDPAHRHLLLDAIESQGQVFVTTTDVALVDRPELGMLGMLDLEAPGVAGVRG